MPTRSVKLPATLRRSPPKAQRTYSKTLENAEREYGSGERASRTAMAALKHSFEKVGDHWEAKKHPGPSDPGARKTTGDGQPRGETFGGVDVLGHTRAELYERASKLDIRNRSRMTKEELARAIAAKQG